MLTHQHVEKLKQLKLIGMQQALEEQLQQADIEQFSFDERLALLLDRETTLRENHRLAARIKKASLKQLACMEDIDFTHPRKLDRHQIMAFASCQWIRSHQNILLIGASDPVT